MSTNEKRDIYLVFGNDGIVMYGKWALSVDAALAGAPAGANARLTAWRRMPGPLAGSGGAEFGARVAGDAVEVAGLRFYLTDAGRPHPISTGKAPMEPMEPDAEVVDEVALAAAAERLGRPVEVTERGTLRRVRVEPPKAPAGRSE